MEKMPLLGGGIVAADGCRVITSKANCCSEGIAFTARTFSAVSAGPIHRSILSGVTYQKWVAASCARGPVGTAHSATLIAPLSFDAGALGRLAECSV